MSASTSTCYATPLHEAPDAASETTDPVIIGTMGESHASAAGYTVTARENPWFERVLASRLAEAGYRGRLELRDARTGMLRLSFRDVRNAPKPPRSLMGR